MEGYENDKEVENEGQAANDAVRPGGCFLFTCSDIWKLSHRLIVVNASRDEVISGDRGDDSMNS